MAIPGTDRRWSLSDVEAGFLDAMAAHGLAPARKLDLIVDGDIHRYTVEGDRSKSDNGWYVLYKDGAVPAGAFGSWKTGQNETWCIGTGQALTPEERAEFKRQMQEAQRAREAETKRVRAEAAERANKLWDTAKPATNDHPYLRAKGAKCYGLRALGDQLLVPVRNDTGKLCSLQFVGADGGKKFITGGEMQGNYCAIGRPGDTVCIAEGYATAATILEATDWAVAVAFNAGNLLAVAKIMRKKFPLARLVFCADNDQWTFAPVENPGVAKATEAANAVGGVLVVPDFSRAQIEEAERLTGKKPTDFNDLHALAGLGAVREALMGKPAERESPAQRAEPGPAADIQEEIQRRLAFEKRIDGADSSDDPFGLLTMVLAPEVMNSGLRQSTIQNLLKKIAKKAGVSKEALTADIPPPQPPGGGPRSGIPDYVEELNSRHAVVYLAGKARILCEKPSPLYPDRLETTFAGRNDFLLLYENQRAFVEGESLDWGTAWLRHPERREYAGVAFAPGREVEFEGIYNLWRGWGVEPSPVGSCARFLDFVREVVCSGDEDKDGAYEYVLRFMAHLVQRPDDLPGAAIVLRGGQRIGKGTFVETLGKLVGPSHYVELTQTRHLTGQFTGHLANALLVFANEATWGGNKNDEGALKAMITDPNSLLEKKGIDAGMVRNYKRLLVGTNNDFPIPRDTDDARFLVLDVNESHKEDWPYFKAIREELEDGGYEALMWHLRFTVDIEDWHPRQIPERLRRFGWDIKIKSADSFTRWWFECLYQGWVVHKPANYAESELFLWPDRDLCEAFRERYYAWGRKRNLPFHQFVEVKEIGRAVANWGLLRKRESAGNRPWFYQFPSLEMARKTFGSKVGIPYEDWPEA